MHRGALFVVVLVGLIERGCQSPWLVHKWLWFYKLYLHVCTKNNARMYIILVHVYVTIHIYTNTCTQACMYYNKLCISISTCTKWQITRAFCSSIAPITYKISSPGPKLRVFRGWPLVTRTIKKYKLQQRSCLIICPCTST